MRAYCWKSKEVFCNLRRTEVPFEKPSAKLLEASEGPRLDEKSEMDG